MEKAEASSPYREKMLALIRAIDREMPMRDENKVLIVLQLDTDQKRIAWFDWVGSKLKGENELDATEEEIVRAAVKINRGEQPE